MDGKQPAILNAETILFDYIGGAKNCIGFSAEQLYSIDPALVNLDAEGRPDSIRVSAFLAYLVSALKDMHERLTALEARDGPPEVL